MARQTNLSVVGGELRDTRGNSRIVFVFSWRQLSRFDGLNPCQGFREKTADAVQNKKWRLQHWPHEARGELLYQVRGWKLNVALQHRELCDTREAWIILVARCSQRHKSHGDKTTPIGTCLSFFVFNRYTWEGAKNRFFSFIPRRSPPRYLPARPPPDPTPSLARHQHYGTNLFPPKACQPFPRTKSPGSVAWCWCAHCSI